MSKNSDYARELIDKFSQLPSVAAKATGKAVYSAVLDNTIQDSGEAAFNWRAQINTPRRYPYESRRGVYPVGSTGDNRMGGFERDLVINYRYGDFIARLEGKEVKDLYIYNPIEDDDHAFHARLDQAAGIATDQNWMDSVAEGAVNAYLSRSK